MFDKVGKASTAKTFLEGQYTFENMAKELENVFEREGLKLPTEINSPVGEMMIRTLPKDEYVLTMT